MKIQTSQLVRLSCELEAKLQDRLVSTGFDNGVRMVSGRQGLPDEYRQVHSGERRTGQRSECLHASRQGGKPTIRPNSGIRKLWSDLVTNSEANGGGIRNEG